MAVVRRWPVPIVVVVIIGGSDEVIFDVVWGPEVVVAIVVRVSVGVDVVTEYSVVNVGSAVVVVADLIGGPVKTVVFVRVGSVATVVVVSLLLCLLVIIICLSFRVCASFLTVGCLFVYLHVFPLTNHCWFLL